MFLCFSKVLCIRLWRYSGAFECSQAFSFVGASLFTMTQWYSSQQIDVWFLFQQLSVASRNICWRQNWSPSRWPRPACRGSTCRWPGVPCQCCSVWEWNTVSANIFYVCWYNHHRQVSRTLILLFSAMNIFHIIWFEDDYKAQSIVYCIFAVATSAILSQLIIKHHNICVLYDCQVA